MYSIPGCIHRRWSTTALCIHSRRLHNNILSTLGVPTYCRVCTVISLYRNFDDLHIALQVITSEILAADEHFVSTQRQSMAIKRMEVHSCSCFIMSMGTLHVSGKCPMSYRVTIFSEWMHVSRTTADVNRTAVFCILKACNMKQFATIPVRHNSLSLNTFKQKLKTHLFGQRRTSSGATVTFL